MVGTRGIPARYGGNEVCAEQIGMRLVERGHEVAVYCRGARNGTDDGATGGVQRVFLPALGRKHLSTLSHSLISTVHASRRRPDILHCFGVGNAPLIPLFNRVGRKTVVSVDGMDWRREKWGRFARAYLKRCAGLAVGLGEACVTDSREVARFYREQFGRDLSYIPSGATIIPPSAADPLQEHGLLERGYLLFVGRLVPEKGVHHLIEAFTGLETGLQLVIVGDGSGAPEYLRQLQSSRDPRVRLLGSVYGPDVGALHRNAYAYVQPSLVEGTSLSLVEAMAYGNCVLVSDIPENLEAVSDAGVAFDSRRGPGALRERLAELIQQPELVARYREKARRFASERYSWERITDSYENLYARLLADTA